jgi:hypothetical protein
MSPEPHEVRRVFVSGAQATATAAAAVPGATVIRAETHTSSASPHEVHPSKTDGTEVTVEPDTNFTLITTGSGFGGSPTGSLASGSSPTSVPPGLTGSHHHPPDGHAIAIAIAIALPRGYGVTVAASPVRITLGTFHRGGVGSTRILTTAGAGPAFLSVPGACNERNRVSNPAPERSRYDILEMYSSAYFSTSPSRAASIDSGLSASFTSASIHGAHSRSVTPASSSFL